MLVNYFRSIKDTQFTTLPEAKSGSWIHVDNATEQDVAQIAGLTNLTTADIDDALDIHEIPRIEHADNNVIIFVRNPIPEREGLFTETLTIIITNEYFITLSPSSNAIIRDLIAKNPDVSTTQRTKLLLTILLHIGNSYTKEIKNVRNNVQSLEGISETVTSSEIVTLTKNEQILNQYLVALVPMRSVFETILAGKLIALYENDNDLLEDLLITIRQLVDNCTVNVKSIRSVRDAYQIIFTNSLNKTIKFLTSFTIILTIPTIMASLFGMNVKLPFAEHPLAFGIVLIFTSIFAGVSLFIFRRRQWL